MMTTPAVDRDEEIHVETRFRTFGGDGTPLSDTPLNEKILRRFRDHRPQSTPVVLDKGIRGCEGFYHTGKVGSTGMGETNVIRVPPGPWWYTSRYQFTDGGFWEPRPFGLGPPAASYSLEQRAIVKALNALKDQKANFAVIFAEMAETSELISNTIRRIAVGVEAWRKKNPRKLWDAVRSYEGSREAVNIRKIPESWLELQYGWNPLMQDVEGVGDALANRVNSFKPHAVVHGNVGETIMDEYHGSSVSLGARYTALRRTIYRGKVTLLYTLNNPELALLSQLGLVNPFEVIWEKLPYSFVVDWFAPVGSWLSALTADYGWSFYSGCFSLKSVTEDVGFKYDFSDTKTFNGQIWEVEDGATPLTERISQFSRNRYFSSPVPWITLKNPLSSHHIANAMSLLVGAFRK